MKVNCKACGAPASVLASGRIVRTCGCPADTPVLVSLSAVLTGEAAVAGETPPPAEEG